MLFNHGWEFVKNEPVDFAPVQLPHDWLIGDPHRLYETGVGYYRRALEPGLWHTGQRVYIRFDGVYMDSTVYLNGRQIFEWKYGCTAFTVDLTEHLRPDAENELLVRVNYQAPNARWYTGAGIYRDVRLIVKNACHFVPDGIYISTRLEDGQWKFTADAEAQTGGKPYQVTHTLLCGDADILPWEPENPRTYIVRSELTVDGAVTDTVETRIGFRSLRFSADEGFFLNGKHLKLKGVCLHGDLGAFGGAVHRDALRRQLAIMKRMGVNAIRTAHNPPAKALMELADEMGLLVMSELLDMWRRPKTEYDYARFFDAWIARDVAAWVRRDRNHPSLILWSVGNEIYDTHADAAEGGKTLQLLMDLVKTHDPKGNAPVTFSSNYMPWRNTQACADQIKLIGYNYAERLYAEHHREHPDWIIFGGETGSTTQSRGVYHFPLKQSRLTEDDLQCSALGNCTTSWGTADLEQMLLQDLATPYSLGQFIWAGQDYLGEPTPYDTKNCYFGHVDTAGFAKDSFHLIRAAWLDAKTCPVVHIYPYWDFSEGAPIDVRVCSNANAVELFFNGESLGRKSLNGRLIADWQLPYRRGELLAVAFDGAGREIARAVCRSFGEAEELRLESEAFGELRFVSITAMDAQSNPVENCNRRVRVSVRGGTLLGLDSGDSTDFEPYQTDNKRMFSGKLLAIVQAQGDAEPKVTAAFDAGDIPVRKIELIAEEHRFSAEIFPKNATYRDLRWRVTNAKGIDHPYAALEVREDGLSALLLPKGDGEMYIRCSADNGKNCADVTGWLRLAVTGLGSACLDPYTFVAGGLYSVSNTALGNGNENGVATLREEASHIGFKDLDFGDFGSDEVRVPLFPMENGELEFELWEGMPGEGGEKLATLRYTLGSEWNVYKEAVYRLPRRIRGVQTICFVFRNKVHMKGFQFIPSVKAFSRLPAGLADGISGDDFTVVGGSVENIGNNVSIVFNGMDFGADGARKITLRWHSERDNNSMQIQFAGDAGVWRQMIELQRAGEYTEGTFTLDEVVNGEQTLTLIFLPGSKLDLDWMMFS